MRPPTARRSGREAAPTARRLGALCVAMICLLSVRRRAFCQTDELPPERQVPILTRALAYDENLKSRAGEELVVAILAKAGNKQSEQTADAISRAFTGLSGIKVQGLPLRSTRITYASASALSSAIQNQGIDAVYVCPGLESELAAIIEVTRRHHVLSMGSREDHINKGVSLGVFMISAKPTICVNLAASKAEGAAFGSDLLRLAKVIR